MSPTEIRINQDYKWRMGLIAAVAAGAYYFIYGYLPTVIWIGLTALAVVLIFNLIKGQSNEPAIVLNDEGVFDRRLKVGVIRWEDIRRISSHDVEGAHYISLELHDQKAYEDRRPVGFRLAAKAHRVHGVSSIAISTNGLEMDHESLVNLIHQGCDEASREET